MATTIEDHLSAARRDIAAGEASMRSAANHIAAAVEAGATQAQAAKQVGKSQSWVNRLLKWRASGFEDSSPFTADNANAAIVSDFKKKIISGTNNPKRDDAPVARGKSAVVEFPPRRVVVASPKKAKARERVSSALEVLLGFFGGDEASMWAAIDEYRAEREIPRTAVH